MDERWAVIPSFEQYSISTFGAVRRGLDRFLAGHINQAGLVYVSLHRGGKQFNRAVSPLVASAFLEPPQHSSWVTPIHLNGNRHDLYYQNLMWRPRWFASEYHYQINTYVDPIDYIRDVATGEQGRLRQICMRYGLLPLKVYLQATNYTDRGNRVTTVWPTGQMFELV